jgi:hypothetical protein
MLSLLRSWAKRPTETRNLWPTTTKTRLRSHWAEREGSRAGRPEPPSCPVRNAQKLRGRLDKRAGISALITVRLPSVPAQSRSGAAKAASNGAGATVKPPPAVPEFLPQIVNCHDEKDPTVVQFADREKVALIAFIAPWVPVRVSPVDEYSASIGLLDEFGVEALVNKLREEKVKRAYLLVNSPGGAMHSSYKIAVAVRQALDHVTTFVPHVAASGGTLLALTGNEIVMGPMSHITPLDTQIRFKREWISAVSSHRFYQRAIGWFEKQTPEEAPYPQRALTEKLDPYLMEEWNGVIDAMTDYVKEILDLSGYSNAGEIATKLVSGYPTHSYVINQKKAHENGLNVVDASERPEAWAVMRHWLGRYLIKQEMTHCVRFVIPDAGKTNSRPNNRRKRATRG